MEQANQTIQTCVEPTPSSGFRPCDLY